MSVAKQPKRRSLAAILPHAVWHWLVGINIGLFVFAISLTTLLQLGTLAAIVAWPTSPWPWLVAVTLVRVCCRRRRRHCTRTHAWPTDQHTPAHKNQT